ncbi:MAG: DUF2452 domain-containing protein [Gammaproteobacteria bacterium]|jgi:hypothetical protein|nr:DUF2452 domain-containing protein [Gammaproteobacteria bacterium]
MTNPTQPEQYPADAQYRSVTPLHEKNPNPQGKGLVPVLRDWAMLRPQVQGQKSVHAFLRDYCLSSLVLAAEFRFKPVPGQSYYLYASKQGWKLSLIAPGEWGKRDFGECLGCCELRSDMTWSVTPAANLQEDSQALAQAQEFVRSFVDTLQAQTSITEQLPFYVEALPYYQRMLATALSSSLNQTLPEGFDNPGTLLESAGYLQWMLPSG